jgi:hypothetical protein
VLRTNYLAYKHWLHLFGWWIKETCPAICQQLNTLITCEFEQ